MALSPLTSASLYRKLQRSVILAALAIALAAIAPAQLATKAKVDKGPRAVGLLELAPNGGARLTPVVIMIEGQFYDASVYKAAPVPIALDPGTVYEAERAGTSLGLFTITEALQAQGKTSGPLWIGEGKFLPAGAKPPKTGEKAEDKPRGIDEGDDKPPVLKRPTAPEPLKAAPPAAAPAPAPAPASAPPAPAPSAPPAAPAPPAPTAATTPAPAPTAPSTQSDDSNRPVLRRGTFSIPETDRLPPAAAGQPPTGATNPKGTPANASAGQGNVQIVAAVSDAGGPEPRPYTFSMKPAEQQEFQKKMLAMAADDVRVRAKQLESETMVAPVHPAARRGSKTKPPAPTFADVQLRVFDLSLSNEPVLVLTATAHLDPGPDSGPPNLQYMITLVARSDIYGELHKVFSNVTDPQHLDIRPRYDLIDAVDADGDGRGELLFRKVFDSGSAYAVFRVIGDQVWPLFDGTPGQ